MCQQAIPAAGSWLIAEERTIALNCGVAAHVLRLSAAGDRGGVLGPHGSYAVLWVRDHLPALVDGRDYLAAWEPIRALFTSLDATDARAVRVVRAMDAAAIAEELVKISKAASTSANALEGGRWPVALSGIRRESAESTCW